MLKGVQMCLDVLLIFAGSPLPTTSPPSPPTVVTNTAPKFTTEDGILFTVEPVTAPTTTTASKQAAAETTTAEATTNLLTYATTFPNDATCCECDTKQPRFTNGSMIAGVFNVGTVTVSVVAGALSALVSLMIIIVAVVCGRTRIPPVKYEVHQRSAYHRIIERLLIMCAIGTWTSTLVCDLLNEGYVHAGLIDEKSGIITGDGIALTGVLFIISIAVTSIRIECFELGIADGFFLGFVYSLYSFSSSRLYTVSSSVHPIYGRIGFIIVGAEIHSVLFVFKRVCLNESTGPSHPFFINRINFSELIHYNILPQPKDDNIDMPERDAGQQAVPADGGLDGANADNNRQDPRANP